MHVFPSHDGCKHQKHVLSVRNDVFCKLSHDVVIIHTPQHEEPQEFDTDFPPNIILTPEASLAKLIDCLNVKAKL